MFRFWGYNTGIWSKNLKKLSFRTLGDKWLSSIIDGPLLKGINTARTTHEEALTTVASWRWLKHRKTFTTPKHRPHAPVAHLYKILVILGYLPRQFPLNTLQLMKEIHFAGIRFVIVQTPVIIIIRLFSSRYWTRSKPLTQSISVRVAIADFSFTCASKHESFPTSATVNTGFVDGILSLSASNGLYTGPDEFTCTYVKIRVVKADSFFVSNTYNYCKPFNASLGSFPINASFWQ